MQGAGSRKQEAGVIHRCWKQEAGSRKQEAGRIRELPAGSRMQDAGSRKAGCKPAVSRLPGSLQGASLHPAPCREPGSCRSRHTAGIQPAYSRLANGLLVYVVYVVYVVYCIGSIRSIRSILYIWPAYSRLTAGLAAICRLTAGSQPASCSTGPAYSRLTAGLQRTGPAYSRLTAGFLLPAASCFPASSTLLPASLLPASSFPASCKPAVSRL